MHAFSVAPFDQNLSIDGKILNDDRATLGALGVIPESVILLKVSSGRPAGASGVSAASLVKDMPCWWSNVGPWRAGVLRGWELLLPLGYPALQRLRGGQHTTRLCPHSHHQLWWWQNTYCCLWTKDRWVSPLGPLWISMWLGVCAVDSQDRQHCQNYHHPSLPDCSRLIFLWQEASFSRPQICFLFHSWKGGLSSGQDWLSAHEPPTTLGSAQWPGLWLWFLCRHLLFLHSWFYLPCVHTFLWFAYFIVVLRQGLYNLGWPSTLASWLLGLQPCTTVPGLFYFGLAGV